MVSDHKSGCHALISTESELKSNWKFIECASATRLRRGKPLWNNSRADRACRGGVRWGMTRAAASCRVWLNTVLLPRGLEEKVQSIRLHQECFLSTVPQQRLAYHNCVSTLHDTNCKIVSKTSFKWPKRLNAHLHILSRNKTALYSIEPKNIKTQNIIIKLRRVSI